MFNAMTQKTKLHIYAAKSIMQRKEMLYSRINAGLCKYPVKKNNLAGYSTLDKHAI